MKCEMIEMFYFALLCAVSSRVTGEAALDVDVVKTSWSTSRFFFSSLDRPFNQQTAQKHFDSSLEPDR